MIHHKNQLKSAKTFSHQLNTLMKIARSSKGLNQPRGFTNHWDVGKSLKEKKEKQHQKHELKKRGRGEDLESFVETKKVKELWIDEEEIKKLKANKNSLLVEKNTIISDRKTIRLLFRKDAKQEEAQLKRNKEKLAQVESSLSQIENRFMKIGLSSKHNQRENLEPFYAKA